MGLKMGLGNAFAQFCNIKRTKGRRRSKIVVEAHGWIAQQDLKKQQQNPAVTKVPPRPTQPYLARLWDSIHGQEEPVGAHEKSRLAQDCENRINEGITAPRALYKQVETVFGL
uniref:Uncharacterized protein n=1 Tax=Mucochytrium quahogii TaxID=96639 RepID=A0A7S2S249_9STRA|mmetsp:Transcript_7503/g.12064  ORF Transcript_7503/g.12064 Transcript_7503/m.12064 type:complete len:113 (+) Transcript_7503:2419-2757(+)